MPTKKKKYNSRFPPARIKKIMRMDEDVGKVAAPVPVIISRALELFVETLLKKVSDVTNDRGARTVTPSHLKMCIHSEARFDFLKELVSDVPDLQGDRDDQQSSNPSSPFIMPSSATSSSITSSTSSNNYNFVTASGQQHASSRTSRGGRSKRSRKLSQDVGGRSSSTSSSTCSKPKSSKRQYVEADLDDGVFLNGNGSDIDLASDEDDEDSSAAVVPSSHSAPATPLAPIAPINLPPFHNNTKTTNNATPPPPPIPAFTLTFPAFESENNHSSVDSNNTKNNHPTFTISAKTNIDSSANIIVNNTPPTSSSSSSVTNSGMFPTIVTRLLESNSATTAAATSSSSITCTTAVDEDYDV